MNFVLKTYFFCFFYLSCFVATGAYAQAPDEVIEIPVPQGALFDRVAGDVKTLEGERVFTFENSEGGQYSLIVRPDYGEQRVSSRKFLFLPGDVEKIIKVSESDVPFLSRSITLEEDLKNTSGFRLTKMDFPSFYWGMETPQIEDNEIVEVSETSDAEPEPIANNFNERLQKSTWIKDKFLWQKHSSLLLNRLKGLGIGQIYIDIELEENEIFPRNSIQLEKFIRNAKSNDIEVSVSLNKGAAGKDNWHRSLKRSLIAIQNFNGSVPDSSKITSTLVDIKPHLINGFSLTNSNWQPDFLTFISELKGLAGSSTLYISIPSWFPGFEDDAFLSERLPEFIDGVLVWSFRKNRLEVNNTINPFLNWGERHNKSIKLGLDAGDLATEKRWKYIKSASGRLVLTPIEGEHYLILLNKNVSMQNKDIYTLAQFKSFPLKMLSFKNDFSNLSALISQLEMDIAYFLTFDGIAINGLPDF